MNESTERRRNVEKTKFLAWKQQELVHFEVYSKFSENENEDILPKMRFVPNFSKYSDLVTETLGSLMGSDNSLNIVQKDKGTVTIIGVPIYTLGGDKIKLKDIVFDRSPKIHKTLSSTGCFVKKWEKDDDFCLYSIFKEKLAVLVMVIDLRK